MKEETAKQRLRQALVKIEKLKVEKHAMNAAFQKAEAETRAAKRQRYDLAQKLDAVERELIESRVAVARLQHQCLGCRPCPDCDGIIGAYAEDHARSCPRSGELDATPAPGRTPTGDELMGAMRKTGKEKP